MTDRSSTTGQSGSSSSSYSGKQNVQEHWNTPISQLPDQITSTGSKSQDYLFVQKDDTGRIHVYGNQDKSQVSNMLSNLQSLFGGEGTTT